MGLYLVNIIPGHLLQTLSQANAEALKPLRRTPPEEFVVRAADGETALCGVLFEPYDFDPDKKYPVIDGIFERRNLRDWSFGVRESDSRALGLRTRAKRLKPEEIGYYAWDFVWVIPGKEAEFEAINKEWIALNAAKKARDPFLTYLGGLGTKSPVYVWFEYGKSAADFAAAEEKFWKTLDEEGAALSTRTRALIRRMKSKTGRYRHDLSHSPEGQ